MSWTDERVDLLKRLWSEGLSASQIAGRLGSVTRNAVIGKVHRLGLSGRATTSRMKTHRPRTRMANAKRPAKAAFRPSRQPSGTRTIYGRRSLRAAGRRNRNSACRAQDHPDADRMQLPLADRRSANGGLPLLRPHQGSASSLLRGSCPARLPARRTAAARPHRGRNACLTGYFGACDRSVGCRSQQAAGLEITRRPAGGSAGGRWKASSPRGDCWLFCSRSGSG